MSTKAEKVGKQLVITLDFHRPKLSKSAKTMLVASSRGVQATGIRINGRMVYSVANAFIYPKKRRRGPP